MKKSGSRYRSYSEKKSQSKRLNRYFFRIFILVLSFSIITSFVAISIKINSDSMNPTIQVGDAIIVVPTNRFTSIFNSNKDIYERGDIVLSGTNYEIEATTLERVLDPVVRIFTLQKKSILYNNDNNAGRAELYRVVGIPGDEIKIKDYTVYIKPKGEEFFLSEFELSNINYDISKNEIPDSWKPEYPFSSEFDETVIAEDSYFIISDNRSVLNDSRVYGVVKSKQIKGRGVLRYWPFNSFETF